MSDLTDQARELANAAPSADSPSQVLADAVRLLADAVDALTEPAPE